MKSYSKFFLFFLLIITLNTFAQQKSYNHWEQEIATDDFGDFKNYEYYYGAYEAPDYQVQAALELTPDYLRIYRMDSDGSLIRFKTGNTIKIKDESGDITTSKEGLKTEQGGINFDSYSTIYNIIKSSKDQRLKIAIYDNYDRLVSSFAIWSIQPDWYRN
ncbi:hypothetical protein [Salegentibacter flavus]|uniref:Uncharacterized protein n=1 Tax=Salegentibacter flavus TaxID=287099 RepID=A0A1I4XHC9_9FLAO|nr:hypothetical protein [Salegentibacter flavus]SFN24913.1 hypothetical protein SAMN05660413_00024 [Salegentibacter flavus]